MIYVTDRRIRMQPYLKTRLDSICYNIEKGFQIFIIISGSSRTRVGKTTLANQAAYYCAERLGRPYKNINLVFTGNELRKVSEKLRPGVFTLDEGRADFSNLRVLREHTQQLLDFINESGKFNNLIFIVIPDFFDLTKSVAIGHSEYLINLFLVKNIKKDKFGDEIESFDRGYYGFYEFDTKKKLYLLGKKELNYDVVSWDFWGEFNDDFVLDEMEYEKRKDEYIMRDRNVQPTGKNLKFKTQRDILLDFLHKKGYSYGEIISVFNKSGLDFDKSTLSKAIKGIEKEKKLRDLYYIEK